MNSARVQSDSFHGDPASLQSPMGQLGGGRPEPRRTDTVLAEVYSELRRLAAAKLKNERANHTLQPTALVHEAYLRLLGGDGGGVGNGPPGAWESRGHFFAAAGEAMRRILIEHARAKGRVKRGGGRAKLALQNVNDLAEADVDDILRFDGVFQKLEHEDPDAAAVVRLRFYAGLSIDQTAEALGLSGSTVDRRWSFARAWINRRLDESE